MQLTQEYKNKVAQALLEKRQHFDGSNAAFAKQWSINGAVFSRIQRGERDKLLKDSQWLNIGRVLGVSVHERKWNVARTEVFEVIEEDVLFCRSASKSRICVSDCGIGKTFTAKYLSRTLNNCFYMDCSQAKTKREFIRLLAKTVGVDATGSLSDIKTNIKYYLKILPNPVVIVDEAGDLEYAAFLELKEFYNATEDICGWYLMGADGLREKIERGIRNKKAGFKEMFSRLLDRYTDVVPAGLNEKKQFYSKLIDDVLNANIDNTDLIREAKANCLIKDEWGNYSGLRRVEGYLYLRTNHA